MAVPTFQNPFTYEIAVPAYNGSSVVIAPKKFVQGSYYYALADEGTLVLWVGDGPESADILYTYPEVEGYFQGTPTEITRVIAGTGLTGGGTSGDVTLSVAANGITSTQLASNAVTSTKVATGVLVKSFNTLTDDVVLEVGTNLLMTTLGNTVTIDAPTIGFTEVSATLPLSLDISTGALVGEVNITPTNDGGAVALQPLVPLTFQTGNIGIDGSFLLDSSGFIGFNYIVNLVSPATDPSYIIIRNEDNLHTFIKLLDSTGNLLVKIDHTGELSATSILAPSAIFGTDAVELDNTPIFKVDTTFAEDIILTKQLRSTVGIEPSLDLTSASTTIPSIKLNGGPTADLMEAKDGSTLTFQLKGDGSLYSKSASFDSLAFNPVIVTAGAYDLSIIEGSLFACDCASGAVTFQLPLIDPEVTVPGTIYTFSKTGTSTNNVLIGPAGGQTINGAASLVITAAWTPVRIAAMIGTGLDPATFWMSV